MGGQVPQGGEGCLFIGEEEKIRKKWGASFQKFLGGAGSSKHKITKVQTWGENIWIRTYEGAENLENGGESAPGNPRLTPPRGKDENEEGSLWKSLGEIGPQGAK